MGLTQEEIDAKKAAEQAEKDVDSQQEAPKLDDERTEGGHGGHS